MCDAPNGRGGAWHRDGVNIVVPTATTAIQKVSPAGGVPTAVTTLGQGENAHERPSFLPAGGRHFFFYAVTGLHPAPVYLASLDSAERKRLLNVDSTNVVYTGGYLLFLSETTLMAQAFDARRLVLTGEASSIAEQIQTQPAGSYTVGVFSASEVGH